jgi:predicted nucleic-acid-binding protein
MIGLDTNVIVRLFVEDDPDQARAARALVASRCSITSPGFIDRVALCELVWVLSSGQGYRRGAIVDVLETLLGSRDLRLEDDELVRLAVRDFKSGNADFADILMGHVNRARGCDATATFDRKAAKLSGFALVPATP